MKKILLIAVAAIMSLTACAQQLMLNNNMHLADSQLMASAPLKAASLDGATTWGYYLGDGSDFVGLGTKSAGTFRVAIFVPGNTILKGSKMMGVNLPVVTTTMTGVSVWGGTTLDDTDLFNKTVASVSTGYNAIALDEPIVIPESGMYVGYTFTIKSATTQAEQYPIACSSDYTPRSLYLSLSATGAFDDYSNSPDFGMSALQIFVDKLDIPDNGAAIEYVNTEACAAGGKGMATVYLMSNGNKGVKNVGYTLVVNGVETSGTATLSHAIPSGLNKSGSFNVEYDAPAEVGAYDASIAITKVNGADNEVAPTPAPFVVSTVTRVVPRMTLIEEFTGTGCPNCPRGWVGMEAVKKNLSDKALVIAWHKYNSTDAMYVANYAALGFEAAPQCTVDRKIYPDPYYGEEEEGILACVNKFNVAVPTVDITLHANFVDETHKQVKITSDTEFLTNTTGYTIAFALTADGLSGSTTAWKQSNNLSQYTQSQYAPYTLPELPEILEFCKGGIYGTSYVALTFNDVLLASTYDAKGKTTVAAFTAGKASEKEASEATINMPTKTTLVNALNYNAIYATAIVVDNNGQVANAARVRVLAPGEEVDGIANITTNAANSDAIYNLAGQKLSAPAHGINIIGGKKVLVK